MARFGSLTDKVLHGQCAVEENTEAFDRVRLRESDCDIVKLKGVDRNGGQFLSCSDKITSVFSLFKVCFIMSSNFFSINNSHMWFLEKCGCFLVRCC